LIVAKAISKFWTAIQFHRAVRLTREKSYSRAWETLQRVYARCNNGAPELSVRPEVNILAALLALRVGLFQRSIDLGNFAIPQIESADNEFNWQEIEYLVAYVRIGLRTASYHSGIMLPESYLTEDAIIANLPREKVRERLLYLFPVRRSAT
jgi:hypothetical protein